MPQLFTDSHCHLNLLPGFNKVEDAAPVVALAESQGVGHILCVAIDMESFDTVLEIARRFDNVSASVGMHPNVSDADEPSIELLCKLAAAKEVVAIGETGLDYFRSSMAASDRQQARFRRHIAAAKRCGKPLIIHCRDARDDTLRILHEESAAEVGGVMHCFVEDWDTAKKALEMNFYISLSGIVTFKSAKKLQDVVKKIPIERMLIETDAPYLAPVPFRGKVNQPGYVKYVAECIAELRGISVDEVAKTTSDNFSKLFGTTPVNSCG